MGKKGKKSQFSNKRKQKKQYVPPREAAHVKSEAEEEAEFLAKYGEGSILVNVLRIWRDTSRMSFLTYAPAVLLEAVYAVVWFILSMMAIISGLKDIGMAGRDAVTAINAAISAAGVPLLLTVLHAIESCRENKKYFTAAWRYVLPGSVLYLLLDIMNNVVAVMFYPERNMLIMEKMKLALWQGGILIAVTAICGLVVQLILTFRSSQSAQPIVPDLRQTGKGVKLGKKR